MQVFHPISKLRLGVDFLCVFHELIMSLRSHIQTLISIFGYIMKRSLQHVYYSYQSYNTIILLPVTQLGISQYSHLLFLSLVKHHGR